MYEKESVGLMQVNCGKAIAARLTFRPLAATIRDTLAWAGTRPDEHEWQAGLKREKEAEDLEAWRQGVKSV
ncbi:MAG: hypothetical protein FVQ83_04105 [Chloroflexi bacterium]|nr:hypothetical protein [Chloroflexota bacterium]